MNLIVFPHSTDLLTDYKIVEILGFAATAVGVFLTYYTLRKTKKSDDKRKSLEIIEKWSAATLDNRRELERSGILTFNYANSDGKPKCISTEKAIAIFDAKAPSPEFDLKFRFFDLLNQCEAIAIAYNSKSVNREMIDQALKHNLMAWYSILEKFIKVVEMRMGGHNPWLPFVQRIKKWQLEIEDKEKDIINRMD